MNNIKELPHTAVAILQRECVISKDKEIATGGFSGCYVISGHDPKTGYHFLAHMDDITKTKDIFEVFKKLQSLDVNLQNIVNLKVMGGLKNSYGKSAKQGVKIQNYIKEAGLLEICDFSNFQQKKCIDEIYDLIYRGELKSETSNEELSNYTHFKGGYIDNQGDFNFFENAQGELEAAQAEANKRTVKEINENFAAKLVDGSWKQLKNRKSIDDFVQYRFIDDDEEVPSWISGKASKKPSEKSLPTTDDWLKDKKNRETLMGQVDVEKILNPKFPLKITVV